ncbi:hypothetical protein M5E86_21885 [Blautia wexlerae]|nr:hypothetical protein M5E86_21885 [Blautia wexlerae]
MNRQTKKEIRRLAVKILVAVLALGLAFWGYAFVYRGKTEPPAKYPVTNQDALQCIHYADRYRCCRSRRS